MSKTYRAEISAFNRGHTLYFPLPPLFVPLTHGRSHRFKSCIAHHFVFNPLPTGQKEKSIPFDIFFLIVTLFYKNLV